MRQLLFALAAFQYLLVWSSPQPELADPDRSIAALGHTPDQWVAERNWHPDPGLPTRAALAWPAPAPAHKPAAIATQPQFARRVRIASYPARPQAPPAALIETA